MFDGFWWIVGDFLLILWVFGDYDDDWWKKRNWWGMGKCQEQVANLVDLGTWITFANFQPSGLLRYFYFGCSTVRSVPGMYTWEMFWCSPVQGFDPKQLTYNIYIYIPVDFLLPKSSLFWLPVHPFKLLVIKLLLSEGKKHRTWTLPIPPKNEVKILVQVHYVIKHPFVGGGSRYHFSPLGCLNGLV